MVCVCILVLIVGLRQGFAHGRHCCIRELHPFSRVPWDCAILSPHPCRFCSLFFNAGSHVAQASASPKKTGIELFLPLVGLQPGTTTPNHSLLLLILHVLDKAICTSACALQCLVTNVRKWAP